VSSKALELYPGRDIIHDVFSSGEPGPCLWPFPPVDQKNATVDGNLLPDRDGTAQEKSELALRT
jgi:hypothetical protein